MIETQVLITVSDSLRPFSRNDFLEGGFTFQWGWGLFLRWGRLDGRGFQKTVAWGGGGGAHAAQPTMGNTDIIFNECQKFQ